ncbi:Sulfite exporter TauE/SafE [Corynebacterium occultum]|uniref:Probable membrane transporter protein n=1 Tax=Corynebacterium occultum TaxID=2675219 RepID=A0A6B8VR23_9CORY|nr:sulfite exporter TauE/SafE family protein [Corynebacterium occultum]QGU08002.1 Sulfite exporter TauE/SafE [Corynebacterium occultum]
MITLAIVLILTVLLGSIFQRITGLGLGLVGGPVLAFVLGPVAGVTMINGLSIINAANNAWAVRKKTDWAKFRVLAGGLILGSLPAVGIIFLVDGPWLMIAIGVMVLLALSVASFKPERFNISPEAKLPMIIAGTAGGFMSTVAGIAGPALTVYARMVKWEHRDFVSTLHPILLVANTLSFLLKIFLVGGMDFAAVPWWLWLLSIVFIFVGASAGDALNKFVSNTWARRLATLLAAGGAISVLIRGIIELL